MLFCRKSISIIQVGCSLVLHAAYNVFTQLNLMKSHSSSCVVVTRRNASELPSPCRELPSSAYPEGQLPYLSYLPISKHRQISTSVTCCSATR